LVDALASGASELTLVEVQALSRAPYCYDRFDTRRLQYVFKYKRQPKLPFPMFLRKFIHYNTSGT
jgi:hypothetical protein